MSRYYLGLSTSGHDPAFALVNEQGKVLFAEATERFLQDKRAWGAAPDHPEHLAEVLSKYCEPDAEFVVATSWKRIKDNGLTDLISVLHPVYEGVWLRNQQRRVHTDAGDSLARHLGLIAPPDRRDYEHHLCHAAYAAWSAPFEDAICLVVDGEGDVGSVSAYRLSKGRLSRIWRSWGPGSLGGFYSWVTEMCGFSWKGGEEWKVMGLAGYGTARSEMVTPLTQILLAQDGKLRLADMPALKEATDTVRGFRRPTEAPLMQAADLAASGQAAFSSIADTLLEYCVGNGTENLILTGGCALNSSFNGTILSRHAFRAVHVPSAPSDDGNAVGAALIAWMEDHPEKELPRSRNDAAGSPFLGSTPTDRQIMAAAQNAGGATVTDFGSNAASRLADVLYEGKIVGVMRGEAEFGPRALGHRSILADPRPAGMKDRLNQQVKGREPYRPFAPMVLAERAAEWFIDAQPSPYMSFALRWREDVRASVPAVVHVDGTGRLQTVEEAADPWLHDLISSFERRSGVPIVLNTSFNVMGKPIVHTVQDAMSVLATTGLDAVLLGNILIQKSSG